MESNLKEVTKDEFDRFIENYPNELKTGFVTICDPPLQCFRDESLSTNGEIGSINCHHITSKKFISNGEYGATLQIIFNQNFQIITNSDQSSIKIKGIIPNCI